MAVEPKISKSQFIRGLQCPKNLWLYRHKKELAPEIDSQKQALFDTGHDIGELAKAYFNGGVEVTESYKEIAAAATTTQKFISEGHDIIFEATAVHPIDGSYSRIDILKKVPGTDQWDLIEVKSSTSVKDYHVDDMSFQYHVFYNAGFRIRACYMMVIDNTYVRQGAIDPSQLFMMEDISPLVFSKQGEVENVAGQLGYILERKDEPDVSIGARCFAPFECDYKAHCWKHVPEYSVYNVFTKAKADEVVKRHSTFDLAKLASDLLPTGNKGIDVASFLSGKTHIQPALIKSFLANLRYPLYFLDYETLMPAIPLFDGTRPFQQIPFQFSVHIQESPGRELVHKEYLHKQKTDPRPDLVRNLVDACGLDGTVIVYNQAFEMARNNELAQEFPQYAAALDAINGRMLDLLVPFRSRWAYHPKQNGSASIKAVLPAFTDLTYEGMEIDNGGEASLQYLMFMQGKLSDEDSKTLWKNLDAYCGQDTYAMKVLLNVLEKSVQEN